MNLTPEILSPLLREYGISSGITGIVPYMNYREKGKIKVIARADMSQRPPLIIKLLREPEHPHEIIERQCVFSEHLRRNGIPTPERYSRGGVYCLERIVDGERVDVTLEDYCGDELTKIDIDTAKEAGALMARIHRISFRDNFKIGAPTIFNAIGKNDVSGIDKLRSLAKIAEESQIKSVTYPHRLCKKPELCREIIAIYDQKIANAAAIWNRLPCSAVQGDISVNNLTRRGGKLAIFDYNIAGDETLVGDLILEGLLSAYNMELVDGLTENDRPAVFRAFLDGYREICPLTPDERLAACEIYPAYNAVWFSRVMDCDGSFPDSLEAVMMGNDCERADEILTKMYSLITSDARRIFASELFSE